MIKYQLKEKGVVKAEGTLLDCWKALIENYGDKTVKTLETFSIVIEPA